MKAPNYSELQQLVYTGIENLLPLNENNVHEIIATKERYRRRANREITIIERLGKEDFFLTAVKLYDFLKKERHAFLGPGRAYSTASLVCYTLGLNDIDPMEYELSPARFLDPEDGNMEIQIEMDEDASNDVFYSIAEHFGQENVARMPMKISKGYNPEKAGAEYAIDNEGNKIYLHVCAIIIALDGVANHVPVNILTDDKGRQFLCLTNYTKSQDLNGAHMYNLLRSEQLTIMNRIYKNLGKTWNRWHWGKVNTENLLETNDNSFIETGFIIGKKARKWFKEYGCEKTTDVLLTAYAYDREPRIPRLWTELYSRYIYPWGINFDEQLFSILMDAAGFTWEETAHVWHVLKTPNPIEEEKLKHQFLKRGVGNGYLESDLNTIWTGCFERKWKLNMKSHAIGLMALHSAFAKMKESYPVLFAEVEKEVKNI